MLSSIFIGDAIYRLCGLLALDPRDVSLRNDIPRPHILFQALVNAAVLLRRDGVLRLKDALVKAVLGDLVDQLGSVGDCQFLTDLILKLRFDLLRLQRCSLRRSASKESHEW